jgi:hypothetical protein
MYPYALLQGYLYLLRIFFMLICMFLIQYRILQLEVISTFDIGAFLDSHHEKLGSSLGERTSKFAKSPAWKSEYKYT